MIEKMLAGADIRLNCDYFDCQEELDACARRVVFTGMIDEFFGYRFGRLQYRSLRFEHESLKIPNYQGNAVVNYTDTEPPYTRIIEHKHFDFGNQPQTIITREYPQEYTPGREPYYPVNNPRNMEILKKYQKLAAEQDRVVFGGRLGTYKYMDMDEAVEEAMVLKD
jgi:UDP-galactopyranose mutase